MPILVSAIVLFLAMSTTTVAAGPDDARTAREIVVEYLEGPCPDDMMDAGRTGRFETLLSLRTDDGVAAIAEALPDVDCRAHELELLEVLGRTPSRISADLLIPYLSDPDVSIRHQALRGIRLHASRIVRRGVIDVPKGPQFPPEVDGLVPYLVEAARDDNVGIRGTALWALTDSRDTVAVTELRRALADDDAGIRFGAACLLTEFDDASGLPILRDVLEWFVHPPDDRNDTGYSGPFYRAEHLLVSFERITGESLGRIPPDPMILSSMSAQREASRNYRRLLREWYDWWEARDAER